MSPARKSLAWTAVLAISVALFLAASAAGATSAATVSARGPVPAPTFAKAYVAHIVVAAPAHVAPDARSRIVTEIGTQSAYVHGPVGLLVLSSVTGAEGIVWLRVRLPIRPNDAAGWIDANDTEIGTTRWRIVVSIARRTVSVYRAGRLMRRFGAVVGKPATPTPTGLFAIYAMARQPPGSELGPWALHLTAHSNVLANYGGGPGRVAIHGRAGPLLADPIGTARSHGCVRVLSEDISWLAAHVSEGTPVLIRDW
jgi:lipoprotein-anchoring transpeptidase ErfK/SrfK